MAGPFKMTDLRRPKESLKPKNVGHIGPDPYSYEHRITLDSDTLDKLGMDAPRVGDKFHVMGHAEVKSVSSNHTQDGDKSTRVELQFKKMGLRPKTGATNGLFNAVSQGVKEASDGT